MLKLQINATGCTNEPMGVRDGAMEVRDGEGEKPQMKTGVTN